MYRYHRSKFIVVASGWKVFAREIPAGNWSAGYRGLDSTVDLVLNVLFCICTSGARITCVGIIQCTILRWGGQAWYYIL